MSLGTRINPVFVACACVVLLSALLGAGLTPEGEAGADLFPVIELPDQSELVMGVVVRVIDGDTILIRVEGKVRRYQLLGADAPELNPKDRAPDPHSINARRFIKQLLLDESVYIQHDPSVDRDGANRIWGYLFRAPDMLLVNLELVRQGYAKHDPRRGALYAESFVFYGARAQELGKGIWNPLGEPLDWSTPSDEPAQAPTAPPASTASPGSTVYITKFGSKYHTKDCSHLTDTRSPAIREEIKEAYKPCKTCKPDDP